DLPLATVTSTCRRRVTICSGVCRFFVMVRLLSYLGDLSFPVVQKAPVRPLFISTISNTQQQAMMTSTFFILTPMLYLSGFIFPIENMPAAIQPLTYLIPLRYFVVILRGIFLKGVGLETLWPQALALFGFGVGILTLAVLRSSKRLA
ncbi:MAG: ABC transporter permease, partial [Acidobacteria bacterium]|nr:ABC transporter permease [Acidobacteriota bacterium]